MERTIQNLSLNLLIKIEELPVSGSHFDFIILLTQRAIEAK